MSPRFHLLPALAALALAVGTLAPQAPAQAKESDHEMARQALERGEVLPLAAVLDKIQQQGWPGQVLKVEFEHEDGRFIYEIRLLQNDGRIAKLAVDAVDGHVLKAKTKDRH